ncbi:hypothetical protein AB4254_11945 [Vibrio breoganii]
MQEILNSSELAKYIEEFSVDNILIEDLPLVATEHLPFESNHLTRVNDKHVANYLDLDSTATARISEGNLIPQLLPLISPTGSSYSVKYYTEDETLMLINQDNKSEALSLEGNVSNHELLSMFYIVHKEVKNLSTDDMLKETAEILTRERVEKAIAKEARITRDAWLSGLDI